VLCVSVTGNVAWRVSVERGERLLCDVAARGLQGQHSNTQQPSGHHVYRQFNIQQFCVQPTQCIYVFCVDLRTNSDCFPIQY
jgi:hypothetical protein